MNTQLRRAALALVMFCCPAVIAQEPTKAEISKQAKAATALVEVANGFKNGSAFCLHDSGIFLTNEHVVRGAAEVKLVLHPGLKNQTVVKARVLRLDKDLDLALLKVEKMVELSPLTLGSSDGLAELTEVIAVGFPFGKGLALGKDEFPAVSVNAGRITALRLKQGNLERIQTDAALNPGNSGGPVLDLKGKVIGVVVSGVRGTAVNFAIPVSHVHRFVAVPDVEVLFPSISYADRYKPAVFQVRAVSLLTAAAPFDVELLLNAGDGKPRSFKMALTEGVYRATAEALCAKGNPAVRVTLSYPAGSLQGIVPDQAIKVGKTELKLSELRSLRFGKEATAILINGKVATGELAGLDGLALDLGTDKVKLNPSKATDLAIHPPSEETSVGYTIIVRRDGKQVARLESTLAFRDVPTAPLGESVKIGIAPPVLARDATEVKLPSVVDDLAVGGGGRFLVLHFPKDKSLGIFDVSQAKLVKVLPLAESHVRFAAGMDKLVIAYPNSGVFQRYSLTSFEREAVKKLEFKGKIHCVALGSASAGPIFVGGPETTEDESKVMAAFLDLNFKLLPVRIKGKIQVSYRDGVPVRASADGRIFCTWGAYAVQSMVVDGLEANIHCGGMGEGAAMPSHDGSLLYTTKGIFTALAKEVEGTKKGPRHSSVPAHGYPYHLSLAEKGLTVHLAGDDRILVALPHVDPKREQVDLWGRTVWTPDRRYHFIPDAKVIIDLPYPNDRLILHRFDMDEALAKANFDYLFVTSTPPTAVRRGENFSYPIAVKSKQAGLVYKLLNGPEGMAVSPAGVVSWPVPNAFSGADAEVLVSIENAGRREIFHAFKLSVR